jgi:hypothetical protein
MHVVRPALRPYVNSPCVDVNTLCLSGRACRASVANVVRRDELKPANWTRTVEELVFLVPKRPSSGPFARLLVVLCGYAAPKSSAERMGPREAGWARSADCRPTRGRRPHFVPWHGISHMETVQNLGGPVSHQAGGSRLGTAPARPDPRGCDDLPPLFSAQVLDGLADVGTIVNL